MTVAPGAYMAVEIAEAPRVFERVIAKGSSLPPLNEIKSFYTVARGSSDAAANIISYEFMRELRLPMTSLPPSIFSLGGNVSLDDAAVVLVSQSGASDDLVRSAQGAKRAGAKVVAIVNVENSPVGEAADAQIAIGAGTERAVPATKSVIGAIGAGMALLSQLVPSYAARAATASQAMQAIDGQQHPLSAKLVSALLRADHVYVIGRDTGFGAAQELALKLKECCAIHAEAYSSSEVLHGPLQLVTNPLLVIILDTALPEIQASLDLGEMRFRQAGAEVFRLRASDVGASQLTPAAAAAALLYLTYPLALKAALALGFNPDQPATLSKVTKTQ